MESTVLIVLVAMSFYWGMFIVEFTCLYKKALAMIFPHIFAALVLLYHMLIKGEL